MHSSLLFVLESTSVFIFERQILYQLSYLECASGSFLHGSGVGKMSVLYNWAERTLDMHSLRLAKQGCLKNTRLFPPLWQGF